MTDNTQAPLPVTHEEYLIRKGGAYYRPNAAGYTYNVEEAGRYSLEDAIRHSHPNGPGGPRDGIDYMPAPVRQSHSLPGDGMREAVNKLLHDAEHYILDLEPAVSHMSAGRKIDRKSAWAAISRVRLGVAALTPSPCPGDGMRAEDVMVAFANHLLDYRQNHLRPDEEHLKAGISRAISLTADPLFPAALTPSALSEKVVKPGFQAEVGDWMLECFGPEIAADHLERGDRWTEEALELAQAIPGFTAERAHALVDYVFSRPVGERGQEVGGSMVTLAALCNSFGINIADEAERELARVWTKIGAIRAKQASKPTGSALPVAVPSALSGDAGEGQALRNVLWQARDTIVQHHQWHAAQTDPDPEHGFIPVDEYADSQLYERTIAAIGAVDKLLETGPRDQEAALPSHQGAE